MAYKLFSLSEEGGIIINKLVILAIPSFKKLLQRDRSHNKVESFKELAYIYHVTDYFSSPNKNGYSPKETKKYAIMKSGLDADYREDDVVKQCIKDYQDEQQNIAYDTIQELLQTFRLTRGLVSKIRMSLEMQLVQPEVTIDVANDILSKIGFIIDASKKIPVITKDLKKAVTELELEKEDLDADTIRGTKELVPMSADPRRDF